MPRAFPSGSRLAGLLYLTVVVTGFFCLAYVPGQLAAPDAQAVLDNVVARQSLVQQGAAAFIVMQVAFLLLALALYRGFQDVSRPAATLMVAFVAVSVPLALAALSHRLQALALLVDADSAQLLPPGQRQYLAHAALEAYRSGMQLVRVFWGLWLLPFGWLALRSGRLPRVLGILLVLGGLGYVLGVLAELLVPGYGAWPLSGYLTLPAALGEIGTCLWLLLFGLRADRTGAISPLAT
ncbi:MAG: DUF4386 domain-containing protein [Xanthomonadales bacterium]|nr:DUF4386 domain-containing protein [Xanthomonadales bacterium]MCA0198582.1 DUF4386 domain-containing protein [Pseudomonadota bacterium]HRF82953.1 DUF4386 domain-containing protein [Pseudoxanthomonas sp.]